MHYYQHHVGDFLKATSCLTDSQSMRYLRLIWLYYDTEKPLPNKPQVLSLKVGGDPDEVSLLLETFFRLEEDGWHNTRCDNEISNFKKMSDGGKVGAAKRWGKGANSPPIAPPLTGQSTPNANQEPITNNQEPVTSNAVPTSPKARRKQQLPVDFFPNELGQSAATAKGLSVANEFQKFHDYPVSKGSVMADWQAAWRTWVGNARGAPSAPTGETAYQRSMREKMSVWAPGIAAKTPDFSQPFTLELNHVAAIESR